MGRTNKKLDCQLFGQFLHLASFRRLKFGHPHLNQYKCCILPERKFSVLSEYVIGFFIAVTVYPYRIYLSAPIFRKNSGKNDQMTSL